MSISPATNESCYTTTNGLNRPLVSYLPTFSSAVFYSRPSTFVCLSVLATASSSTSLYLFFHIFSQLSAPDSPLLPRYQIRFQWNEDLWQRTKFFIINLKLHFTTMKYRFRIGSTFSPNTQWIKKFRLFRHIIRHSIMETVTNTLANTVDNNKGNHHTFHTIRRFVAPSMNGLF